MEDQTKPRSTSSYIYEIAISVGWTIAFWFEVGMTSEADCQGPTWILSNIAKIFYLVNSVFCFILMVACCSHTTEVFKFLSVLNSLVKLAGFALMIGMIISFANIDECPDLYVIILIQFIFIMILFGLLALGCCVMCVVCCFGKTETQRPPILSVQLLVSR